VIEARRQVGDLSLDIYGTGQPRSFFELAGMIESLSAGQFVRLKGPISHESVQDTIGRYAAFAMPTLQESYGMVFAEALLAGVPIVQTMGWGLHGLYPDVDVGYACANPRSHREVAQGIVTILSNEERLKARIAELQSRGAFDILRRDGIAEAYRAALESVVGSSARHPDKPAPSSFASVGAAERTASRPIVEVGAGASPGKADAGFPKRDMRERKNAGLGPAPLDRDAL
jgi:glycosyltransferase involved in cell wall biosynthesis